jgi:hypothetical protein
LARSEELDDTQDHMRSTNEGISQMASTATREERMNGFLPDALFFKILIS